MDAWNPLQLDLFGAPPKPEPSPSSIPWGRDVQELAARLPATIKLGTSSWTFPGWGGLCYPRGVTEQQLLREGLALYSRFPLFRTVGIDRSYYGPLKAEELAEYAGQLPDGFTCIEKVWQRVVSLVEPSTGTLVRTGLNPDFLNAELFFERVHRPHVGVFEDHLAAYVLEFPPMPSSVRPKPAEFAARLARFLDEAPYGPRYAVELRNRELMSDDYFRVLREHGVSHVYNFWQDMPMPAAQLGEADPPGDLLIMRLLLPPGGRYVARKASFAPFDKLHEPSEAMREDVDRFMELSVKLKRDLHVVVNNKAEGSSPLTVMELARRWAGLPD